MPSARTSNKVRVLLGLGWSTLRIANALEITPPSLRKHYFSELKTRDMARDVLEADLMLVLCNEADGGNIGAIKQLQLRLDRADMEARARQAAGETDLPKVAPRPVAKGKKDLARGAAEDLLTDNPILNPLRVN